DPHPRPHRPSAGPPRAQRGAAAAGRAGGPGAHHRHGGRDRRPLRREPRHLRAGRRAALPAGLAARQGPVGRRAPGVPAQDPHGPPRQPVDHPPVRGPGPVLRPLRVRARHHGRRPRLHVDRLRGRHQGGDAPRRRAGRQGRGRDRRRRDDRRRRLRGAAPGRRPRDPDRRGPQRQRHVDLAERRRDVAVLQPHAARAGAVEGARGRRGAPGQASGGHRRALRAPRPAAQGVHQGLLGARPVVGGARLGLHGRHRRPRRPRPALGPPCGLRGAAPRGRPHRHGQGQGLRAGRGRRPGGHGEVARGQARVDLPAPSRAAAGQGPRRQAQAADLHRGLRQRARGRVPARLA
ncbi:MAG: 1-deoxy-D-xylulose 5-phosphate synthase, partial [uncultured Solirubrobacteraceae bacterium]